MSAIAKAVTSQTGMDGMEQSLGSSVRTYTAGFGSTKGLMIVGVCLILLPVLAGIGVTFDRQPPKSPFQFGLFMAAIFFPLGIPALLFGIRQQRVRLTLFEHGFEHVTPGGKRKSARYADIKSVALRKVGLGLRLLAPATAQTVAHDPNSLAVELKGGWSFRIKCLSVKDLKDAYEELARRSGCL